MKAAFLTGILLVFYLAGLSQSVTELRDKKKNAAREIEYINKLLKEVEKDETASVSKLRLINSRLQQRNELISGINQEIRLYQEFIDNNNYVVKSMNADLERIRKEYARLIQFAYRNRSLQSNIMFLLSADSFNQAYRRFLYMKRYTAYRKSQIQTIEALQDLLEAKVAKLKQFQQERQQLIEQTKAEAQKITQERNQHNAELQKLKKQQKDLTKKLNDQRRIEQDLEREIQRMIEEEASKNKKAGSPAYAMTPEQKLVSGQFEQNKRKLPWPTERGIITERFGIHQHPVLSHVQIRSNGITIATEAGASVRAIFDGEVSRVFGITGGNSAVIIRHGNYLTVYSNLSEVIVKKGDKVSTKQNIGKVYTDKEDGNKSVLKFQVWRENQKLDPEEWIGR